MLFKRMLRVIKLDGNVYEEVLRDPYGGAQAITVVIVVAVATLIGALSAYSLNLGNSDVTFSSTVIRSLLVVPGSWLLQAGCALVFSRFALDASGRRVTSQQLMTVLAFSIAPGIFLIFSFNVFLAFFVGVGSLVWLVVTMTHAVYKIVGGTPTRALMFVLPGALIRFVFLGAVVSRFAGSDSSTATETAAAITAAFFLPG